MSDDDDELRPSLERIETLLAGHTDRRDEAGILEVLAETTGATLGRLLSALDLPRLIGDVDDRRFGPKNRTALFDLLCSDRLADLNVRARAAFVSALQVGRTDALDEAAITRVLLGTRGSDLTALKNLLDHGADHRDLQQLVYSDVDDEGRRAAILEHLAREGAGAPTPRPVKVLSDIDDTFYCNWVDTRYPKKTVYPGIRQLYRELDAGPGRDERMGDVAFVTARPKDRPGLVERVTHKTLRERGVEDPTVLAGSFVHLLGNESIAKKKLQNFLEYAALFPEYDFVFIGDSGQGDATFGARMREELPDRVQAVLIHDVVASSEAQRAKWDEVGVCFFDTYIGAARLTLEMGLIHPDGCRAVIESALLDLAEIAFETPDDSEARHDEHERDRTLAQQTLSRG